MRECKPSDLGNFLLEYQAGAFTPFSIGIAFCKEFYIPLEGHAYSYLSEAMEEEELSDLVIERIILN